MRSQRPIGGRVLLIEADHALGMLYHDLLRTHCPGVRIDLCGPADRTLIEDNAGGADVAVLSCGVRPVTRFDTLRELLTLRACLTTLVLVPAESPRLGDEAIEVGATDVLLRAPGYLEQLPLMVRKNVAVSRARTAEGVHIRELVRALHAAESEASELRARVVTPPRHRPLPEITIVPARTPVLRLSDAA